MASLSIWAGGIPLDAISPDVHVGDVAFSTAWGDGGGGLDQVSWSMVAPKRFSHPLFRVGAKITLKYGPMPLGSATLAEPNYDEWTFQASGLRSRAARLYAVDGSGNPTRIISTAVNAQLANLRWSIGTVLPTTPVNGVDISNGPVTVSALLDAYCDANAKRWRIDAGGALWIETDPTTPRWALLPGTPAMQSADDDFATTLRVRYVSAIDGSGNATAYAYTSASDARAAAQWDVYEDFQDISGAGLLTAGTAATMAASVLATEQPRPAYTTPVRIAYGTLANLGGVDASDAWWMVRGGQLVQHHGWRNISGSLAPGLSQNWLIGATSYSRDQGLQIAPIALAPRTTTDVIAKITAGAFR